MTTSFAPAVGEYERLRKFADAYLEALQSHAPQSLPISPLLKVTENCQPIALGTGVWRTVRDVRPAGQYFVDVVRRQVAFWGVIEEPGGQAIFGVRLAMAGRLIAEIEAVVVRGGGDVFEPEVVVADAPELHSIVEPAQRVPRSELVAGVAAYFDGIELCDGARIPMRPCVRRLVNGVNDSNVDPEGLDEHRMYLSLDVAEQITAGHYGYIETIRERRYPILDEERGLCHAVVVFDHPGNLPQPNGELPFSSPNSLILFEVFKMARDGISEVHAIGTGVPYGCPSGWA